MKTYLHHSLIWATQAIGVVFITLLMLVLLPVFFGAFLILFLAFITAWAFGLPIKVTTPGRTPGTKVSHHYRWFTRID
jgi:hypothetical protein